MTAAEIKSRMAILPSYFHGRAADPPRALSTGNAISRPGASLTPPDRARYRAQSSLRRLRKLVCDAIHPPPQGWRERECALPFDSISKVHEIVLREPF